MAYIRPLLTVRNQKITFSEQEVINYINSYKEKIFNLSQKKLSKNTYTSEATISRLVKKLNFKNYKDFVIKINFTINELNKKYPLYKETGEMEIAKNIINSHLYAVAEGMDASVIKELDEVADMINKLKGFLIIFGIGSSNRVAQELTTNLQRLRIPAITTNDFHRFLPMISLSSNKDIIILFSNYAINKEIGFIIEIAKNNNTHLVLITSNGMPPFSPSRLIHYKKIHNDKYEVPISSKTIQNVIADVLFRMVITKNPSLKSKLKKSLSIIDRWRESF